MLTLIQYPSLRNRKKEAELRFVFQLISCAVIIILFICELLGWA